MTAPAKKTSKAKAESNRHTATKKRGRKKAPPVEVIDRTDVDLAEKITSKMTKEEVAPCRSITVNEARSLVGSFYAIQKARIGSVNKLRAHKQKDVELNEVEFDFLNKRKEELFIIEKKTAKGLKEWAESKKLGRWAMQVKGIGPVLTAGLMSHIDLTRCCCDQYRGWKDRHKNPIPQHDCPGLVTAGAIWKFAGMIPPEHLIWEKGKKRPYNATLKTLCFKVGSNFKMARINKKDKDKNIIEEYDISGPEWLYVRLYRERKKLEFERNESGCNKDAALLRLNKARSAGWNISQEQRDIWKSGKLQPMGVDLRAMRHAVKIFLSHWHTVGMEILGLPVKAPWVIVHGGHSHYIAPPLWPMKEE